MFDLYYFSFYVTDQVHQPDLPGVLISPPIKKGSHARDGDMVMLYLSLSGTNPYTPSDLNALLQRATLAYYKSTGSLTAGIRAAAEVCNTQLLERNLKNARDEGGQSIGRMNLAVLRDDTLFLAVAGPAHAYVLGTQEVQDFYDPQAGRGLGSDSSVGLRYFQAKMQPGDVLAFSPEPPATWTPNALNGSSALTLEHLRRRLLNGIGPNLQAVVCKFQSGSGEVHALRHRSTTNQPAAAAPMAHPSVSQPVPGDAPSTYLSESSRGSLPANPALPVSTLPVEVHAVANRSLPPKRPPLPPAAAPIRPSIPDQKPEPSPEERLLDQAAALETARAARQRRAEQKRKAAAAWAGWKGFTGRIGQGWKAFITRLAPQRATATASGQVVQSSSRISPALLVFIAIAVPLVVVAVSLTVYLQSGRSELRTNYYQQAVAFQKQALAEKDPVLKRNAWNQVLMWLDKAEEYGSSDESQAMRRQAQQGVDAGDAILRLEFQPFSRVGLANAVQIIRLLTNSDDVYGLDASNGSVLRFFLTAQGYELDTNFNCGPGPLGSVYIGSIVDMTTMPQVNKNNATIAAVDAGGNLLYCIPGKPAVVRTLAAPNVGWGKIGSISLVQDTLYVLDVLGNAVWQYSGKDLLFQDRPRLFSEKFNITLADAVEISMYEDYIYFLKKDGQLIQCTVSRVAELPTRCVNPVKFSDNRPGREKKPDQMPETHFTDMLSINAPDPSLYLLDASHTSVYRFSVVLNFQDQMRPSGLGDTQLPRREPTAFTITPRRLVFLAYGNQMFMAQMP